MRTLKERIAALKDLKRQHEIKCYRYYTRDCQAVLLEAICEEIPEKGPTVYIPRKHYNILAEQHDNMTDDIRKLLDVFKSATNANKHRAKIDKN